MVDMVVHRHQMRETLSRMVRMLMKAPSREVPSTALVPVEELIALALSDAILTRLLTLHPKIIDLSLGRMEAILAKLGHPERKLPPVIHVAGTNGKGSTVAYLRHIMEAAGLKVHAYTSPHLVKFHERIRVAGELISEADLTALLEECETVNAR